MINERARLQYLEALGVQSYMPRVLLPEAPTPRLVDYSFLPAELEAARPTTKTVERKVESSAQSIDQVLDRIRAPQAARVVEVNREAAARPTISDDKPEPVKLNVGFWVVADLLILADRHPEQALPVNKLLANILVALRRPVPDQQPEILHWPAEGVAPHRLGQVDDYLLTMLQAKRPADESVTLLCFGEQISRALSSTDAQSLTLPAGDELSVLYLPSLETLLLEPHQKADVWAAIKHLRP